MEDTDALAVLGLPGPADPAQVKAAYRRLARELHPDAGGDTERFRRVQLAYEAISNGTSALVDGPRAQVHVAGVEERWWEAAGAWHDGPVDTAGVRLDRTPGSTATAADVELVASLVHAPHRPPVHGLRLHSRAPGSRLHRFVGLLDPDLLASIEIRPVTEGRRPGHDVAVEVRARGGRGRRHLASVPLPTQWVRRRGSDTVSVERSLRPCHDPAATAVRVAREVDVVTRAMQWPLHEWFVLRTDRPT